MTLLLALLACNESGLTKIQYDAIGVVLGDFDDVTSTLTALDIGTTGVDGFIVQATYEPSGSRTQRGEMGLSIEGMLASLDERGKPALERYNAFFVASGTRGLGAGQYNNVLLPDDGLLLDPNLSRLCNVANNGGSLIVSDWAYELVETCWPDAIRFFGEGEQVVPDAAQKGIADDTLDAYVQDETLAASLGGTLSLRYDYTAWTLMEGVGAETEVLVTGDGQFQPASDEPIADATDVPLLVRFKAGRGQVIYSNFHWSAQAPAVAQTLLLGAVEGLAPGAGDQSDEVVP